MKKKIIFCLIIFFCLFAFVNFSLAEACPAGTKYIEGKCVRALEITYPKIAGEELTIERVVREGLPGYVNYIFTVAVGLIGFVIFAVLIYNGIRYLTSVGRPEQMADARSGILYAFLGGLLLLSSVLIFKTINPQLAIMELPEIKPLGQVVAAGVYICNYKADEANLKEALEGYIRKEGQEHDAAVEKLRKIIWNPETERGCTKVVSTGNFQGFQLTANNTIFIVPSISIDLGTGKRTAKNKYGIVLHEKDNFGGQCDYFPKKGDTLIYEQIESFSAKNLKFTARSVILFQKPLVEPVGDGVTLFQHFHYEGTAKSFKPGGGADLKKVRAADLGNLKEDARSIRFPPEGSYFTLLFEGENFDKRCRLLRSNTPNLIDLLPICGGKGCEGLIRWGYRAAAWVGWAREEAERCVPCLNSMIIIKGSIL